jgi:hypothetical protein
VRIVFNFQIFLLKTDKINSDKNIFRLLKNVLLRLYFIRDHRKTVDLKGEFGCIGGETVSRGIARSGF